MLTLGAAQASTWGYSVNGLIPPGLVGGGNNLPSFTKFTLGPDGNLYAISSNGGNFAPVINGTTQPTVILKVIPGTSNTGTTNYSEATFEYIYPDSGLAPNQSGFAKPVWNGRAGANAEVTFNTGILASNGLIYWPPLGSDRFVIFNPANGLWKLSNIHPDSVDSTTSIAKKIYGCVVGGDNKIYVIPALNNKLYRIVPSTNASADTWEQGFYTTTTPLGLFNTDMSYYDNNGTLQSNDTSITTIGAGTVTRAYAGSLNTGREVFNTIADAIYHPSGRIYLIPAGGRGRIFYINTGTDWNTNKQVVSEPGLTIATASGVNKVPYFAYAFLEKPRDTQHNLSTLKIYLMPQCPSRTSQSATALYANENYEMMYINPTTNTLHEIPMNFVYNTSSNQYQVGKRISLPNGLNITVNLSAASAFQGGAVLTGIDVPSSDTDGAYTIKRTATRFDNIPINGITANQSVGLLYNSEPGQVNTAGGGNNLPYPHHSKFITNTGGAISDGGFIELVSVKEYGPGITNFNFVDRDKNTYAPPSNLGGLGQSLYNSNFNKPK
jgi:hypothetical protein